MLSPINKRMQKLITLTILFTFGSFVSFAQFRQVYSSAGNSVQKGNIYLSQSIGQDVSFTQNADPNRYVAQGFQQPMLRSNVSLDSGYELIVFPNPTNNQFSISGFDGRGLLDAQLYDVNGALCDLSFSFQSDLLQANMLGKPSGIYLLRLVMINGDLQTIKIIKTDQ